MIVALAVVLLTLFWTFLHYVLVLLNENHNSLVTKSFTWQQRASLSLDIIILGLFWGLFLPWS